MKQFHPGGKNNFASSFTKATAIFIFILCALLPRANAQGLIFKNSTLHTGIAGELNAIYRFPAVTTNVDALIQISDRSSSLVKLESIDLTNTGFDKAFQPQVSYNNGTAPNGVSDWWMEFTVTFVRSGSTTPVAVNGFGVTALDIDGNGDKINEWVGLYGHKTYTLENNSSLSNNSIWEILNLVNTIVGTKFTGPKTNYLNIDTSATQVMTTVNYENLNGMRIRTGGHSTGQSGASERMYSFWFKTFSYQAPVELRLPVVLKSFSATVANNKPVLNWISSKEQNFSHYMLERSTNGTDYTQAALIFGSETATPENKYAYTDSKAPSGSNVLYYRLKMVDLDGQFKFSETKIVRLGSADTKSLAIQAFPNPASNEIRVSVPTNWQNQKVQYEIYTINGQSIRRVQRSNASQTEVIDISSLPPGSYIVKATADKESAIQQFVKSK
ncbi:MAG: T9SS type A sorting domain-containing protein [Chitinophagaceae bacterium]|nr:T9SS type A sorting domain-containing protein [Chitinophagaceae bacterium]